MIIGIVKSRIFDYFYPVISNRSVNLPRWKVKLPVNGWLEKVTGRSDLTLDGWWGGVWR